MTSTPAQIDCEYVRKRFQAITEPREKLQFILGIVEPLLERSPSCVREFVRLGLNLAGRLDDRINGGRMLYYEGVSWCLSGNFQSARESLAGAYEQFVEAGCGMNAAKTAHTLATIYRNDGQLTQAIEWFTTSLEGCSENDHQKGDSLESLGRIYHSIGDYARALDYLYRACAVRESLKDPVPIAVTLRSLAKVRVSLEDYPGALAELQRALELLRGSGNMREEVRVLSDIGSIYCTLGDLPKALEYELKAQTIYEILHDALGISDTLTNIGKIFEQQEETEKAMIHQTRALEALGGSREYARRAAIILCIGCLYQRTEHFHDARFVLEQALLIARDIGERSLQAQIHLALSQAYEQLKDLQNALEHHRAYCRIREGISGEQKQKEIAALHVRFDVERMERERDKFRVQAEDNAREVQSKQNELTAMTLYLLEMSQLVDSLKIKLRQISKSSAKETQQVVDSMLDDLDTSAGAEATWKAFEQQLGQIHHDFVRTVSERFPMLAKRELQICSLLKLGLATKEIASLLHLTVRTVETHRFNIRKKLKPFFPDPKMSLESFLAAI